LPGAIRPRRLSASCTGRYLERPHWPSSPTPRLFLHRYELWIHSSRPRTSTSHVRTSSTVLRPLTVTLVKRLAFRQVAGGVVTRRPEIHHYMPTPLHASPTDPAYLVTSPPWTQPPRQHADRAPYHNLVLLPILTTAGSVRETAKTSADFAATRSREEIPKARRAPRTRTALWFAGAGLK
jgi:hypothetical protein